MLNAENGYVLKSRGQGGACKELQTDQYDSLKGKLENFWQKKKKKANK